MPFEPASDVLSHITVIDLTRVRSGPTCVRQLADWGANVIKIEDPTADPAGDMGGPRDGPDFQNLHRNKRAMTLDLKSPEGIAVFKKLAAKAASLPVGQAVVPAVREGQCLLAQRQQAEARKELDAAIVILADKAAWLPELAELRRLH